MERMREADVIRLRLAELCAGYGGLGMALESLGLGHELAWYAENSPEPASVMAHHYPTAPNLGDLTDIVDPPPADIVAAGFPCQPVSQAGGRGGTNDERWIIDDVCRVAGAAGARWLILENVVGLLTANDGDAMARVCAAMAEAGFSRWEWRTLRASDIGAPHQRERWFCLAATDAGSLGWGPWPGPGPSQPAELRWYGPGDNSRETPTATDTGGEQPERRRERGELATETRLPREPDRPGTDPFRSSAGDRRTTAQRFGRYAGSVARWERISGRLAPDPTVDGRLSPRFVEWMMGLPGGHVTSVAGLSRAAQLRILGNGVVPQQAAAALVSICWL